MLIFGGETTDGALHNTMWRFDLGKKIAVQRLVFFKQHFAFGMLVQF